ncbi:recombinase [Nocardia sp. NPDC050793]|uniref:recombinase n=1 Tax=Nocardia sp. NPDC050793 TaxID=3155159 RepID=UPI0033E2F17A
MKRSARPADPSTLAQFLAEHPDAVPTQRRRIAAINRAHRAAGHPEPGRAAAVRAALDVNRAARWTRLQAAVDELLPALPMWGWTAGLFGRRDALLLTLAAGGLPFAAIGRLTQADLDITNEQVRIGEAPLLELAATGDPARCPVAVARRWTSVLVVAESAAGKPKLQHHLSQQTLPEVGLHPDHGHHPLLLPFDRHGYTPLTLAPLSAESARALVLAHLTGRAPVHRPPRARRRAQSSPAAPPPVRHPDVVLSDDYYDHGIAARARGQQLLADVPDLLDDVMTRTEKILANLLDLFGPETD